MIDEIETEEEFIIACGTIIPMLNAMADYLEQKDEDGLSGNEVLWFFTVAVSYKYLLQKSDRDGDDGSDFRVDDTLY